MRRLLTLLLLIAPCAFSQGYVPKLPIKASANNRYFVDQNNVPWLMVGDSAHNAICNLAQSNWTTYLADRQAKGFNTVFIFAVNGASSCAHTTGAAQDGTIPFNKTVTTTCDTPGTGFSDYDLTCPNAAYWSEVDTFVSNAASDGLVVSMNPLPWGDDSNGTPYINNGTTKVFNFGVFLGNRYKNSKNIIWLTGQDFNQSSFPSATDLNLVAQLMAGIASVDTNHFDACQLNFFRSYSNQGIASGNTSYNNNLGADFVYTYFEIYDYMQAAYANTTIHPTFIGESNFETANNTGQLSSPANAFITRQEMWYPATNGAAGFFFGNEHINHFDSSYPAALTTTATAQVNYVRQLLYPYAWWKLVPDTGHVVVTAGFGTAAPSNENLYNTTLATTAWITDGSLAIVYTPVTATLTVNMAQFSGLVAARWYDPTTGLFQTVNGSPFTNSGSLTFTTPSGTHADGTSTNDWVLVLNAAQWTSILNGVAAANGGPNRAIDWTNMGVGLIPARPTICSTIQASTLGNGSSDATSGIQTALNSCPANQTVLLSAGTFLLNGGVAIPTEVTLRGAGADQTILNTHGTGAGGPITMGSGTPSYTGVLNITAGNTSGSTLLTLSSTAGVVVGNYLVVSEANDTTYVTNLGGEGTCTWCDNWSTNGGRARGQIVRVVSISGSVVGIEPGLYSTYALANSPTVVPFAMSADHVGLENLQIFMNNTYTSAEGTASVVIETCAYCWVRGIEVNYADGDYVYEAFDYHNEIRDNYFSNAFLHAPGSTDADIFLIWKTSATLVENNIFERCHACLFPSRGAAGNVIAYNFVEGSFDSASTNFTIGGIGSHGAHAQYNLYEGNVFPLFYPDQVWGSSSHNTSFRNWVKGTSLACLPTSGRGTINCTGSSGHFLYQAARAMQIAHISTNYNLIGDVLGSTEAQALVNNNSVALTQTASVAYPSIRNFDTNYYGYSWGYGESNDTGSGNGCSGGTPPCNGTQAFSSGFVHGDYNNVDGSITWSGTITHTLPSTFYLMTTPTWMGSLAIPLVGPDVTGGTGPGGHTALKASNPAQNCFYTVMHGVDGGAGGPYTFNAGVCYYGALAIVSNLPGAPAANMFALK